MPEFDLPHDFFSCRWRREPVFLPGGAKAFLDVPPEREEILARIEEEHRTRATARPSGSWKGSPRDFTASSDWWNALAPTSNGTTSGATSS
ncbi:hypothetical protein ACFQZC_26710 [Streptacidiphilus monticola]